MRLPAATRRPVKRQDAASTLTDAFPYHSSGGAAALRFMDLAERAGKMNLRREDVSHISADMKEIVFEVTQEEDGGYVAEAMGEAIFTQADTWDELRDNVREAVLAYYFDQSPPERIRLHLIRDEVLSA